MATLQDLNIFSTVPTYYEGLLGPEETKALQSRANTQGLLGAAIGLLGGMGTRGTTASQNIAAALGGGLQSSQGAVQQGITNYSQAQQLKAQQRQQELLLRQQAGIQAMKMKYPELADELDTNPAGAFRIIADIEKEKRTQPKRNTAVINGVLVDTDTGLPIYTSPAGQEKPVVVGNALVNPATGQPIYTAPAAPRERKTAVVNGVLVDTETGKPIYTAPREPKTQESLYSKTPIADANGQMVFMPTKPGLPVLNLQGQPVSNYAGAVPTKPIPPVIQKAEDQDFETGQAAINLATDANKYINSIKSGAIPFGLINKGSTAVRSVIGSDAPDVIARNDYNSFKTRLVNETLRLNKGVQTEGDAIRATNEFLASDSAAGQAKAMQNILDINLRAANLANKSVLRRRANAKLGAPEVTLEIPKFEPHVFGDADYAAFLKDNKYPKGTVFIDPAGVRRVKP